MLIIHGVQKNFYQKKIFETSNRKIYTKVFLGTLQPSYSAIWGINNVRSEFTFYVIPNDDLPLVQISYFQSAYFYSNLFYNIFVLFLARSASCTLHYILYKFICSTLWRRALKIRLYKKEHIAVSFRNLSCSSEK